MRHLLLLLLALPSCGRLAEVGKAPSFSPADETFQYHAMYALPIPENLGNPGPTAGSSLWAGDRASLLGDRRASRRGDILTVAIEIDDRAEISNSTGRSRSGGESLGLPSFFGIPQRIDRHLPDGASMEDAVSTSSSSSYSGDGSVRRKEKLTLRVAATVVEELPNGVLRIQGQQEVRVNYELRELVVTGYVRPGDISRQNEITYDKIAEARISYGGRGQITDVQQPRYGQQVADIILPF
ncbi:flagellar basal body L-ring protein FlgH [Cereibacter azotoformans]|uniref:Flagellar L-ring protein n=1 Tax=Cereibacter azotoformans TaxID=43057 RepID=A0A2T5JU21_9RHOB|nr:flagellar basal body L-ring protein FlgH [Cereibacter azotoformans]AXQ94993.1 flagellar basal body L-ring protein FlgH [Cereibacter sphaeroides]MBO4170121.1 flagellar basal body L-ring protein FlgH [Cereibacter azotoformans]PTR13656.1 flagellar L-ring protein precursor FlgH [Cereibacter azotoformans]UIJ30582.1 flagellar basal body L-ring protein FlgH [Cereibacter azotoformans]